MNSIVITHSFIHSFMHSCIHAFMHSCIPIRADVDAALIRARVASPLMTTPRTLAGILTVALAVARAHARTDDAFVGDDAARYVVHIPKEPLEITPATPHRRVPMTSADGKKYLCRIPERAMDEDENEDGEDDDGVIIRGDATAETASTTTTAETESTTTLRDVERAKSVDRHLAPLEGKCFYYGNGDWWTYEMCHKSHVEQFHREGAARVSAYSLGRFDADATLGLETTRGTDGDASVSGGGGSASSVLENRPYHAHAFVGGSACEDVGDAYRETKRRSEVRFVCAEDGAEGVSSVEEPATCRYVLTFRTPLACEVEDLRPKRPGVERIACSLVDDGGDDATPRRDADDEDVPRDADDESIEETTARASRDEL